MRMRVEGRRRAGVTVFALVLITLFLASCNSRLTVAEAGYYRDPGYYDLHSDRRTYRHRYSFGCYDNYGYQYSHGHYRYWRGYGTYGSIARC